MRVHSTSTYYKYLQVIFDIILETVMKSQHANVYNEVTSVKNPEGEHMCPPLTPGAR